MTKRTRQEWENIIEEHAKSGMSIGAFCIAKGVALSTFQRHRQKFLKEHASALPTVHVARISLGLTSRLDSGIYLRLGDVEIGIKEGFSQVSLSRVLEVLR